MTAQSQQKAPYTKPQVVKVPLVPDELAVTGCKTLRGNGPTTGCVIYGACRGAGS